MPEADDDTGSSLNPTVADRVIVRWSRADRRAFVRADGFGTRRLQTFATPGKPAAQ